MELNCEWVCTFEWKCMYTLFWRGKLPWNENEPKSCILFQWRTALVMSALKTFRIKIKGQLISKCFYEKSDSSKIPKKIFLEFCPEIFCSFLEASWKLFGLPGDLVSNIINKEDYWKPKKLPGSPQKATKNFRAEIQK